MNTMSDGNNQAGSAYAGSRASGPESTTTPTGQPAGQQQSQAEITPEMYQALERKLGEMGNELGAHRDFFNTVSPLLEKLDANPKLVQAIIDNKIDGDLAQAVLDGKVSVSDAQVVTQAANEVKKELGNAKYAGMTEDQVAALVEKKIGETRQQLEAAAELKDFEARTQGFINSTPDFMSYAEEIDKWLDTHNVADIEVAYYAVKGQMSTKEAQKAAEEAEAERAKEIALNASGGGSHATTTPDGRPLIDELVGGPVNPLFR